MSAAPIVAVSTAASLDRQHGEAFRLELCYILSYCLPLGTMHRDPHLVQPGKSSRTDTSNNNGINFLIIERFHRIACTMRVVLVSIVDRRNSVRVSIDNDKYGGRAKMVIYRALDPIVRLDRKTDLHVKFLLRMIYTTFMQTR